MIRVLAVFPEPTPYRAPLLDCVAARPGLELLVVYAARTVANRTWAIAKSHQAYVLRGVRVPGAVRILRHDYPLTPGILRLLERERPDCVVVSGWSTFAAQAAIGWCRLRRVPYLVVVESHDYDRRAGWRRLVKRAVVPRVLRPAAGVLVTGTLARASVLALGARRDRVAVFANTVDVEAFGRRADELLGRRAELRSALGLADEDVCVLSVARLVPEKNLETLVRAVAAAGRPLVLAVAGDGPARAELEQLARALGVRLVLEGDVPVERVVELYIAADVFALLSQHEPWGVVVNEAASCGLPLVLSDRVGAAHDLLRSGENGFLVGAWDVEAAATALRALAGDPALRARAGAASRRLVAGWGYEASVDALVSLVSVATADSA